MYSAKGSQKHPTLNLLHGFTGKERNLDLAQVVRDWNSQGRESLERRGKTQPGKSIQSLK